MIEYEQISPDVIKVTGVYEGDIRLNLGKIYTDFDEPLFDGVNAEELEQITAKMKELQKKKLKSKPVGWDGYDPSAPNGFD